MFSFFKRKPALSGNGLEGLVCDVHSHLIPGIDDGAGDMESSLQLIRGLMSFGYRKIITTPHINCHGFPNTPAVIRQGEAAVRAALAGQQMDVEFHAAAEYLIDEGFMEALGRGDPFLTLKDNLLLVELPFVVPALNLKDILFQLQMKGYQPVLAHPERYLYFGANKTWYDELRNAGCLFQLNLLSFRGHYGAPPQELADYLIKKNYVEFLGTDLHRMQHLEGLQSARIARKTAALLDTGRILNPRL